MRKFRSEYQNGKYKVGCTGGTVVIINSETNEIIDKIKMPYCYYGTFVNDKDVFIAKSTAGYLLKYDLKTNELTKIRTSSQTQDGGFAVCPWDNHFYNVEMCKTGFQIAIYDVDTFKIRKLVPMYGDVCNVYGIEFGDRPVWYVALSYSYQGYVRKAIAQMNEYDLVEIRDIDHDSFKHFVGYEYWMRCGFTDEARIVAEMLSEKYQIPMTMAELYNLKLE